MINLPHFGPLGGDVSGEIGRTGADRLGDQAGPTLLEDGILANDFLWASILSQIAFGVPGAPPQRSTPPDSPTAPPLVLPPK